jgi:hypothetical protein
VIPRPPAASPPRRYADWSSSASSISATEEPYEPDLHGYMIVVEAGDSVQDLEEESGCPFAYFEVLEELDTCYETVFVPGDGDFGVVIFIPKLAGIDPDLLAVCAEYAVPAP